MSGSCDLQGTPAADGEGESAQSCDGPRAWAATASDTQGKSPRSQ